MPVLQRRLDDPGIAIGPVVAASGDQANAIPLALQTEAVAVVLNLVQPDRAIGDTGLAGRQANSNMLGIGGGA